MKDTDFQAIIKPIYTQTNNCEFVLREYIYCGENVHCMPIGSINKTIESCKAIQSKMDKFLTADLYHIIGMTDFNAAQMSQFVAATKDLMNYRCAVKMFAYMTPIPDVYNMTAKHSYTLSSGVKLENSGKIKKN